jgi:hypothetical protein
MLFKISYVIAVGIHPKGKGLLAVKFLGCLGVSICLFLGWVLLLFVADRIPPVIMR